MVNKRLKLFEKLVKNDEINLIHWQIHFPHRRPDKCKCKDCVDFTMGLCSGGQDPFVCMQIRAE